VSRWRKRLRELRARLRRFEAELNSIFAPWSEPIDAPWRRRESAQDALRKAAKTLELSHARGRAWGEQKVFVSAALVEGSDTCVVTAKFRRELGLGLTLFGARVRHPESFDNLRPVALKPPLADSLRAFAREPDIARRLLARRPVIRSLETLAREGLVTLDDDRVQLVLELANISSRSIQVGVRGVSSLAYELRRLRTEYPRSEHELPVREAWSRQASARGGQFDQLAEVLTFDSHAGEVRVSIERDGDSARHDWSTSIALAFKRSLTLSTVEALPALSQLEELTSKLELDTRCLRARVAHAVHDPAELEKLIEAVLAAGAAVEESSMLDRSAYR